MPVLRDKADGRVLGTVTEKQLEFLIQQLEEESETDQDYWLHRPTIEMLRGNGGDDQLIALLDTALGTRNEIEIVWS